MPSKCTPRIQKQIRNKGHSRPKTKKIIPGPSVSDPDPATDEISSKSQKSSYYLGLFDYFETIFILLI
jgi:hypothetical protein